MDLSCLWLLAFALGEFPAARTVPSFFVATRSLQLAGDLALDEETGELVTFPDCLLFDLAERRGPTFAEPIPLPEDPLVRFLRFPQPLLLVRCSSFDRHSGSFQHLLWIPQRDKGPGRSSLSAIYPATLRRFPVPVGYGARSTPQLGQLDRAQSVGRSRRYPANEIGIQQPYRAATKVAGRVVEPPDPVAPFVSAWCS